MFLLVTYKKFIKLNVVIVKISSWFFALKIIIFRFRGCQLKLGGGSSPPSPGAPEFNAINNVLYHSNRARMHTDQKINIICRISGFNFLSCVKWYSGLKNYFEIDNYNATLHWYTCTHNVYSLFNDIYNSKCAFAAVLLTAQQPSQLPLLSSRHGPLNFRVRGNKQSHRKLAITWQLGNFGHKQSQGLLKLNLVNWMVSDLYFFIFDSEAWISL